MEKSLILFITCFTVLLSAQYPSTIGTKWEYSRVINKVPLEVIPQFTDEIISDTLVNGVSFKKVKREGDVISWNDDRFMIEGRRDVSGYYYFRYEDERVIILDSSDNSMNYESLLYDFSLKSGDFFNSDSQNFVDLTTKGYPFFSLQDRCPIPDNLSQTCSNVELDIESDSTYHLLGGLLKWNKKLGTIYVGSTGPTITVLGATADEITLTKLTTDNIVLYDAFLITSIASKDERIERVEVFPNPCTNTIKIEGVNKNTSFKILNCTGHVVFSDFLNDERILDVSGLQRGVYYIDLFKGQPLRFFKE